MDDDQRKPWPDESVDPPDYSAPVGARQFVPENLLAMDHTWATVMVPDENGHPTERVDFVVTDPEAWKLAAKLRGVDTDA